MYFIKKSDKTLKSKIIKTDFKDSLIPINVTMWNKICKRKPPKKKIVNDGDLNYKMLFEKANEKVEKEMCLFNML